MNMFGVGIVGWIHSTACVVALLVGAWMLAATKGTAAHRRVGLTYVVTMLIANVTVFAIYHFDIQFAPLRTGPGIFGLFHWFAVVTLIVLAYGVLAATHQRYAFFAYTHPVAMVFTYWMLVGGLINELYVRVPFLRALARASMPPGAGAGQSPLVGMTQLAWTAITLIVLVVFIVQVARYRRNLRAAPALAPAE